MKGRWITYSADEMAWLEDNRAMVISDYHRAFNEAFSRDVSLQNLHALRKRKGWRTGRTGCFEKGSVPPNKGVPCAPGTGAHHPNAVATRFKKGNRSGRANDNYQPIGTERLSQDGYREIKIHDGMPLQSRWRLVHLVEWEAVNGPIPEGQCLKCVDGDRTNTAPANWQMIPRALLPRLNGGRHKKRLAYDDAEAEVKPILMTLAKVEQQAFEAKRRVRAITPQSRAA